MLVYFLERYFILWFKSFISVFFNGVDVNINEFIISIVDDGIWNSGFFFQNKKNCYNIFLNVFLQQ